MESRPPQEPPRRPGPPNNGRKPNGGGSGTSPTPPWLWVFLIAVVALITWLIKPSNEVTVNYSPWFLEQVKADNVESIATQNTRVQGKLRKESEYETPGTQSKIKVSKFVAYLPTEKALDDVLAVLK